MLNDDADLAQWRAYLAYDPDLEPWPHVLSTLGDVRERLEATLNYVQALGDGNANDKQLGVTIATLAFTYVDRVYRHLGLEYESLAHTPRNHTLALLALKNLLVDALAKQRAGQLQVSDVEDEPDLLAALLNTTAEEPNPNRRKPAEIPDDYEANIRIKKYLDTHPKATIREVSGAVGLSTGKVSKMDAWRRAMAERKAKKKPVNKTDRPLTPKMLKAIGQEDDLVAKIDAEEAVWQRLLDEAAPKERARLHTLNPEERRRLIEVAGSQYAEELADKKETD